MTKSLLGAAVGLVSLAGSASANILVNGSFEDFIGPEWSMSGNLGRSNGAPLAFVASHGDYGMNFNGGDLQPNGQLAQTFATVPGNDYTLSFDFGKWYFGFGTAALQVDVLSGAVPVLSETVSDDTGENTSLMWNSYQFHFTATDSISTLVFIDRSNGTGGYDGFLDNVRIVPAPSGLAMLAAGALSLGRRRRR